jgi:hemolysin III
MGWLIVIAIRPLWLALPSPGLPWLVAGGLSYTVGVAFYALDDKWEYAHFVWHLFVLGGSASHFLAIRICVL